jgi:hypothetical protein
MTLQRERGQYLLGYSTLYSLGMREIKVVLRAGRIIEKRGEYSTSSRTSCLIIDQQVWKKSAMKPSRPTDFP